MSGHPAIGWVPIDGGTELSIACELMLLKGLEIMPLT